jgi:hypothetical protein
LNHKVGGRAKGKGGDVKRSDFREGGVYALPDGRELIASESGIRFKLYDPLAWKYRGPALYEIEGEVDGKVRGPGLLTSMGRPTQWRLDDLTDRGLTVTRRLPLGVR